MLDAVASFAKHQVFKAENTETKEIVAIKAAPGPEQADAAEPPCVCYDHHWPQVKEGRPCLGRLSS